MTDEHATDDMNPGDQAPANIAGAGELACPDCNGSGELEGKTCETCEGTGKVIQAIGGG